MVKNATAAGAGRTTSIQVVDRMLHLIDALASSDEALSLTALAHATGLHPSTAHRILAAMVQGGFADRSATGGYRLGMRFLELGNAVRARLSVREAALPAMRELARATGETVNLSVRQGDEILYVERTAENRSMMRVVQTVGARAPLHITAAGKLFLAQEGAEAVADYASRTGLAARTPNSTTTLAALAAELAEVRRLGFARDREEAEQGVGCIAAAVTDDTGATIAALSLSAPADRQKPEQWTPLVRAAAARVSKAMGGRG
ncbi:MAG: IclR family transcriptional regulator [Burkholderiales bacterium]|nr:IclR family transcriptional regulator [Burkholderiales bacterium]